MFKFLINCSAKKICTDLPINTLARFIFIAGCVLFSLDLLADCPPRVQCTGFSESECSATPGCYWSNGSCVKCGVGQYCPANDANAHKCSDLPQNENFKVRYTATGLSSSDEGCNSENDCVAFKSCTLMDDTEVDQTSCNIYKSEPGKLVCEGQTFSLGNNDSNVHIDTGYSNKCFQNILNCKVLSGQNSHVNPESYAVYHYSGCSSDGYFWDVEQCEYNETVNNFSYSGDIYLEDEIFSFNTHCTAQVRKGPGKKTQPMYIYSNGCNSGVPETFWYTKPGQFNLDPLTNAYTELRSYYCAGCKNGYQPSLSSPTNAACLAKPNNNSTTTVSRVCQCEHIPKGNYALSNGCSWSSSLTPLNVASLISDCVGNCPIGQTTDGTGSTSASDCHYTTETEFCDTKGCFSLSDIENWTPVN